MLAIVVGSALLFWSPGSHDDPSAGLILIVLACACWAIDNNLTRKVSASDATLIAWLKGLVAGSVNLVLALLLGQELPPPGALSAALLVGFFGYGISLVLFVLALRHLGTARAGAYFSVAPFFGAALAVVVQGDAVTPQLVAAGLSMAAMSVSRTAGEPGFPTSPPSRTSNSVNGKMKKPPSTRVAMAARGLPHTARLADASHNTPETSCP
jgi:drug/metabolite transporter (DMT)-like permease